MKATTKDLSLHSKDLLDSVKRGKEVVITFRGKPCAKLVPYEKQKNKTEGNALFGMWKDNDAVRNVDEYVRKLRNGRI